jgi:phosphoribosyl 1,2-cyclic phosphodiesterase
LNPIIPISGQDSLRITYRGVRGSTPSPGPDTLRYGGNTACIELRAGSSILILDAGTGIRVLGSDLQSEFGEQPLDATILISHTHWDHIQGLPFFSPGFRSRNRIRVMAPRGKSPLLLRALQNQMDPLHFPVGLNLMDGLKGVEELTSDLVDIGSMQVRVTSLNHPGGCSGFRVETGGGSLAYLPDHEPYHRGQGRASRERTDALVEFISGVDLLILDTQYTEAEYPARRGWGHGCLLDSVSMAVQAGVRRLSLFHHDPTHDDRQIDAMVLRARELSTKSGLLVEGAAENQTIVLSGAGVPLRPTPVPAKERVAHA